MESKKKFKPIAAALALLVLLVIQVVIISTDYFNPETELGIYAVEVLKVFIYINSAWLILLAIRYFIKKSKK